MSTTELREASGSTSLPLSGRDESWDAGAAQKSLQPGDFPKAHFWHIPGEPADQIGSYKFPFAHRTGDGLVAVWKGVTAGAQRLSSAKDVNVKAIQAKMAVYYNKAAKAYGDEEIEPPWQTGDEQETSSRAAGDACADCQHDAAMHEDGVGPCQAANCDCQGYSAGESTREFRYATAPLEFVEIRDPTESYDNSWMMTGYAAVFNQETVLHDSKFMRVTEDIDPAAFDRCLREQGIDSPGGVVHFNFGHDMNRAVAATNVPAGQIGSLQLRADRRGLAFTARVSRTDPDAVAMAEKMRTGVLKQASFAFTINKAEWTDSEETDGPEVSHRRIMEIGHLYDVCATPQGAYSQTLSQLRSIAQQIHPDLVVLSQQPFDRSNGAEAVPVRPDNGSGIVVRPEQQPGSGVANRRLPADLVRLTAKHRRR